NTATDASLMNLRLAAHLINHPTSPARYVCVVDSGIQPSQDAGGFDTHQLDCSPQATNVLHSLESLVSVIRKPGDNDPSKLDLDKTLIIINTDFGRTPGAEGTTKKGRGHWPFGFPIILIGGPVSSANHGIYGACGPDAKATLAIKPQEHR